MLLAVLVGAAIVCVLVLLGALARGGAEVGTVETPTTTPVPTRLVVGVSVQGRPIELHAFGSGEWRVLVVGGVHGDECGGIVARAFLAYLSRHPEAIPAGALLQLIPSANPDGEAQGVRGNANSVDLNRNFPSQNWLRELNPGDRPTPGLTGGSSPGSEPETQALLSILDDGWDLVVSLHSSGGFVDPDGEGGMAIAERMSAVSGLPVGGLDYQSHITGSLGIFVPERYQVPVITVELESEVLTDEIRDALLAALVPSY
jgi:protein MpaA